MIAQIVIQLADKLGRHPATKSLGSACDIGRGRTLDSAAQVGANSRSHRSKRSLLDSAKISSASPDCFASCAFESMDRSPRDGAKRERHLPDRPRSPARSASRFSPALRKLRQHLRLQLQDCGRRFLAGFHARLMIGVDVHERAVKPDRAFIERDQRADVKRIHLRDADRDRFALAFVKRRARPAQESLQIIAAGHALLDFEPLASRDPCAPR